MIRRLGVIAALLSFLPCFLNAKGPPKTFNFYDFSKGLDSYHNPATLPDGFVQDAQNVLFDDKAPVTKRAGYAVAWSTKQYSFQNLWTYVDASNNTWQIAKSSDQITASNLIGTTVLVATVAVNSLVGETNAFGNAYFVDQNQGVYYWNGALTTYIAGSPKGSIIVTFHGRVWVTGLAVPNGNQLYGSGYFAGTNWTTGLNATDPVQYSVGLADNYDSITAEYVYLDTMYIFKHFSIYALYGFDQTNFQISQLTQECGCVDGGSIQTFNAAMHFASARGIEKFNGYSCTRESDQIKDKVDPAIQQSGFSQQSWVQQTQADWQAGTFNASNSLSSTIQPPALVMASATVTDTGFLNGTLTNVTNTGGVLQIATNNSGNITNPSFESSFLGNWAASGGGFDPWAQVVSVNGYCGTVLPESGSAMAGMGTVGVPSVFFQASDLNNNILQSVSLSPLGNLCNWVQETLTPSSSNIGQRVKFRIHKTNARGTNDLITSDSYIWGGPISFYFNSVCDTSDCSNVDGVQVDNVTLGSSTITSGTFYSQSFDTTFSSAVVDFSTTSVINGEGIQTVVRHTTVPPGVFTDLSSNQNISAQTNRYLQYVTTFTILSGDASALSTLNSATFQWIPSSAAFKSQIHNVGSINSWGDLNVTDVLNNAALTFSVCGSTNANMSPPVSCAVETPNSQIMISTKTYVQFYATFTVTSLGQTFMNNSLNNVTLNWYSGNLPVPMSSVVWDNRYWLALTTTTTDSSNDAILVLNTNGAWTDMNIHAAALTLTKNQLYHADSNTTGNIYLDNQGFSDNGVPIEAHIRTKELSLGDLASDDYLRVLYPAATNTGACVMNVSYVMDNSTNTYKLGSPLLSEFGTVVSVRLPFPVDSVHQDFGQAIDMTFGTQDSNCAWQFYGAEGQSVARPVQ